MQPKKKTFNLDQMALLAADLAKVSHDLTAEETRTLQKKITLDIFAGVIFRTPVDEGVARGAWQISIGNLPSDSVQRVDKTEDEFSSPTYLTGLQQLGALDFWDIVFITNNVKYVLVLDQGLFVPENPGPSKDPRPDRLGEILVEGGYSVQAPTGMVDVTLESVRLR